MKKQSLKWYLLFLVSTSVYAFPAWEIAKQKESQSLIPTARTNSAQDCVDFTGEWEGECKINGQPGGKHFVRILQISCGALIENGTIKSLGAYSQTTHSYPEMNQETAIANTLDFYDWNPERTEIRSTHLTTTRTLGQDPKLFSSKGTSLLKMDGRKLVNETQISELKVECSFDKKP